MKRAYLIAILVSIAFASFLASNASAMYNPTLGRFMQRDPLGYVDGTNVYEYVRSTPIRAMDFTGLKHNERTLLLPPTGRNFTCDCEQPDALAPGKPAEPCKSEDLKSSNDSSCKTELTNALGKESVKNLLERVKKAGGTPITIECRSCTCGCKGAGAWHFAGDQRGIYICDGQEFGGSDKMETYLLHELTHELQTIRNDADISCADRMKLEMDAYMSEPGVSFENAVKGAVWSSCYAMRCGPDEINQSLIGKFYDMWKSTHP